MASARRTGTNENISTYGGGGRDYTALATWEAATDNDLVTATTSEVLECYTDSASYNDSIVMAGSTTNSSYFRILRPAAGHAHSGTPTTGIRLEPTTSPTRTVGLDENWSQVQDICATNNTSSAGTRACFWSNAGSNQAFVGCIGKGTNPGTGAGYSFRFAGTGGPNAAVDCLGYEAKSANFISDAAGTALYYNCTAISGGVSNFAASAGTITARNCLGDAAVTTDFSGTFTTEEYNASSDSTAAGTGSRTLQTFTFADAANDDYHLAFADAGAKDFGTDLSADPTYAFDDDIDSATITTWSIGFDSDPSAPGGGGAAEGAMLLMRRRRR